MKKLLHLRTSEIFVSLCASTTAIAKGKDAHGFSENKEAATEGGSIAGNARKELELKSGGKVSTSENYLQEPEKEKRKRISKDHISSLEER